MIRLTKVYQKNKRFMETFLFPAVLVLYPFLGVCQGLDVADSTYSLANFQYFGQMDGTWMVATFLSNAWGSLLMHLPFGGTIIGMNCYTTLVQSAVALMVYLTFRGKIPTPLLFLGEMIALGLCWCPSVILYQNLTYFFMTAGVLFLYRGLTEPNPGRFDFRSIDAGKERREDDDLAGGILPNERQRLCFVAAGLCLGANVAVRMPNVVHAAFILMVWYGIVLRVKLNSDDYGIKETGRPLAVSTGWCLAGYLAGFGLPLLAICLRYGVSAYPDMVRTLFAMTEKATDYKPVSMLTGMFGDYGRGLYWLAFAALCMAAAGLAFAVREKLYGAGLSGKERGGGHANDEKASAGWGTYRITGVIVKAGFCLFLVVLLRFYWGKKMFTFLYYDYSGIYDPAVLLLLVIIGTAVYCLLKKGMTAEKKILAAAVLLEIFLTPLGSNNRLYPMINNLFLAVPFLLWIAYDETSDEARREGHTSAAAFLWQFPLIGLTAFVLVQSIGFHAGFAFNDGVWGEPRDLRVTLPGKAAGIWTRQENGILLEELVRFAEEEGLTGREVIAYDELPGLSYLLDMPPALSTGWPALDSYRMEEYLRDMESVEAAHGRGKNLPVIIVSAPTAAYLSDDGEAIAWFGVDMEACAADEKLRILRAFLEKYSYAERFGNAGYVVYRAE